MKRIPHQNMLHRFLSMLLKSATTIHSNLKIEHEVQSYLQQPNQEGSLHCSPHPSIQETGLVHRQYKSVLVPSIQPPYGDWPSLSTSASTSVCPISLSLLRSLSASALSCAIRYSCSTCINKSSTLLWLPIARIEFNCRLTSKETLTEVMFGEPMLSPVRRLARSNLSVSVFCEAIHRFAVDTGVVDWAR